MIWAILAVAGWLGCGLLAGGWITASFRYRFALIEGDQSHANSNFSLALMCLWLGPVAAITAVILGDFRYGWIITRTPLSVSDQWAFLRLNRP